MTMQSRYKDQEGSIHVFGEKSKAANWMMSHIFLVVGIIALFGFLLFIDEGIEKMERVLMTMPFFFGPAILIRFLWRDRCYRVEFDTETERIWFFRFFHKDVVEAPVRSVEFSCDRTQVILQLVCTYAGVKYTVGLEYMDPIAELLPQGVEIEFPENFGGRLAKSQSDKRRQAIRGSRSKNPKGTEKR